MNRAPRPRLALTARLAAALPGLVALLAGGAVVLGPAGTASATVVRHTPAAPSSTSGWLRIAHLSPDTPNVDVYLTPFGGRTPIVLRGVGYGDVSPYRAVPAGVYTAAMWLSGHGRSGAPILSGSANVAASHAYTVAAVGRRADITAKVLRDDLTPPEQGKGRVRLIQASTQASVVDLKAVGGPELATHATFGSSSGYATVPAGRWTLNVTPQTGSAKPLTTTVDVSAGSITSLLLLDGSAGILKLGSIVDSKGAATMPAGAVNTGYGPPAPARGSLPGGSAPTSAVLVLTGLGVVALARRVRTRAT